MNLRETPFNTLTQAQRQQELARVLRDPAYRTMIELIHDGLKARFQDALVEQKAALLRSGRTEEEALRIIAAAAVTLPDYVRRLNRGEIC